MKGLTINDLTLMCLAQQRAGNGEKRILMSSDDECNEYHQVWEGFMDGKDVAQYVDMYQIRTSNVTSQEDLAKNWVILT